MAFIRRTSETGMNVCSCASLDTTCVLCEDEPVIHAKVRKFMPRSRERIGSWQLDQVWTGHCPGKCYIFDNGTNAPGLSYLYHIPAVDFWGK